jgi:hypothetical protein
LPLTGSDADTFSFCDATELRRRHDDRRGARIALIMR